jgi:DNA-directed RNA polymerase specialized sigma24 family protein
MFGAKKTARQESTLYATRADFCRIFERDVNRLYILSFLLTADPSMAEVCFVRGLEDSAKGNPVFKEWAQSWARRVIIQNAIRTVQPRATDSSVSSNKSTRGASRVVIEPAEIASIVKLPAFERFAFVMSVLERYSDQECSVLLSCTRAEVIAARTRALQQIGRAAERHLVTGVTSDSPALRERRSVVYLQVTSPLAASA